MDKYLDFELLPKLARENLLELADKVIGINPIKIESIRILTSALNSQDERIAIIDELSTKIQHNHNYIYYIRAINNHNLREVEHSFSSAKEKVQIAFPRFNGQSEFLYVGSSLNLIQRIKDHLGYTSTKTYSLQLSHWATDLNLELDFVYAQYARSVPAGIVQIIEDTLWDQVKPMFGRQGKR